MATIPKVSLTLEQRKEKIIRNLSSTSEEEIIDYLLDFSYKIIFIEKRLIFLNFFGLFLDKDERNEKDLKKIFVIENKYKLLYIYLILISSLILSYNLLFNIA